MSKKKLLKKAMKAEMPDMKMPEASEKAGKGGKMAVLSQALKKFKSK